MELSILLMEQIAKLFLMIFMGYAVVKLGLLTDEDSKVLSTLVLYLIVPIVTFMLGEKWVFYACVFMGLQTIFFWTHCKNVLSHEKGFNPKKIFSNINLITIIIAITLFFVTDKRTYFISFMRLITIPLIALLILKISGLKGWNKDGEQILLIVFMAVISPVASTVTQMCQVYDNDSRYASAINVLTTIGAIVTMPLMVFMYQIII